MTPKQQSILERYGIQNPPEWSGMTGQGADTMYSIGGKWMKAGQTHPSGYTVGQYDPKSKALGMSIHGVNIPVGMKSGTVKNFETPVNPYNKTLFGAGAGAGAYANDPTASIPLQYDGEDGNERQVSFDLDEMLKSPQYAIDKKYMDIIRKNSAKSGTMSDYEIKNIIHLEDYVKQQKEGSLKPDTKYYVPTKDGQLEVFMTKTPDQQTYQ